eukprot:TRINITY_DN12948_c0_g2_i1.p1 TRINITY_DN12948_c0_g2~~TRINITY_DN12948_c0_g2_i1.p1  ORF type:complete len:863 (+),score=125.53 TRINITY_DN12948_c0_g2_i1:360-2591(+)
MAEFPNDLEKIRETILAYMSAQAEQRLGYEPGSSTLIREKVALFSSVSQKCADHVRTLVENRFFEPGQLIMTAPTADEALEAEPPGDLSEAEPKELYIILSGKATLESDILKSRPIALPEVAGEAVLLGCTRHYPHSIRAETMCIVQVLRLDRVLPVVGQYTEDRQLLQRCRQEAEKVGARQLRERLHLSRAFKSCTCEFIAALVRIPDIVVYPPGAAIIQQGNECTLGISPFFLVLVGQISSHGSQGTFFGKLSAGQVFGEVGAFGLSNRRLATAQAWQEGLVCCHRFAGSVIMDAIEKFPGATSIFTKGWTEVEARNAKVELDRQNWIQNTAIPSLARTPLLAGCPNEFLHPLAIELKEQKYKAGEVIVKVGDKLNSMLVMLQGHACIESRTGDRIARLVEGSVFGEVNALGLFPSCMATLRATSDCRLLSLPDTSIKEVLNSSNAKNEGIAEAFQCLCDSRHAQVQQGVPIVSMNIGASVDDVRVRAIALLAERIELQPGDLWTPVADNDPCGPFFGVLLQGRATVEVGLERHIVTQLTSGSLFMEGLAAHYGAVARAETFCEAFRVRQSDFLMAVGCSDPLPTSDWIWRFKLQEKKSFERLHKRLQSVQGLLNLSAPNVKDREIEAWKNRRKDGLKRARSIKHPQEEVSELPVQQLPPLPNKPKQDVSDKPITRSVSQSRMQSWEAQVSKKPGLKAYPVLQLPQIPNGNGGGSNRGTVGTGQTMSYSKSDSAIRRSDRL